MVDMSAQNDDGRAMLISMLRVVREQAEVVGSATVAMSALLQVTTEKFPEMGGAYERYREVAERTSPTAVANRRLVAELDRLIVAIEQQS